MQNAITAALFALLSAATTPPDPVGVWKTPVDDGLVKLERCGADLCGRAVGSSRLATSPDQKDVKNPDAALRGRPIQGLLILRMHAKGPGRWGDGWIYNPKDGQTYKAELTVINPQQVHLRGCIVAPFCKTQTWTRSE